MARARESPPCRRIRHLEVYLFTAPSSERAHAPPSIIPFPTASGFPQPVSIRITDHTIGRGPTRYSLSHYPLSNMTEARYQQQPSGSNTFQQSVGPLMPSPNSGSFSAEQSPSTSDSAARSGWEPRGELPGVTTLTPTHGAHAS
ncbi:hypothetical protein BC826DRAFT_984651 [Russula brevipes]|nr:hypothetical protein BC826DRAFT_984651 [Russula brevipes]